MCARAGDEACGAKARSGRKGRRRAETHTSTPVVAGVEGAGGTGGHGRASRSTTPSEARVWRSRGRPGPTAPGTPAEPHSNNTGPDGERAGFETTRRAEGSRRGRLAGGPPPTGTPSGPAPQPGTPAPGTPAAPHSNNTGPDGERAGRPRGGRRSIGGTSDNSRIYSPARRSTSCMMRPHTALTHATAATPRTRERQGRICRKSSKP